MTRKPKPVQPAWRYYDLLILLGSANEIRRMLEAKGYKPPPENTVQGWRNRNSIPGKWVPVMLQLAVEKGFIKDIDDLRYTSKAA